MIIKGHQYNNNLQFLLLSIFSRKRHHGKINNTRYILSGFLVISFRGLSTVLAVYIKLPPLYNLFCIHLSDHHDNTLKSIPLKPLWMEQTSLAEEISSSFFGFLVSSLHYGFCPYPLTKSLSNKISIVHNNFPSTALLVLNFGILTRQYRVLKCDIIKN